jgi:autotransporter passenger strand-loop-strand repeat protein
MSSYYVSSGVTSTGVDLSYDSMFVLSDGVVIDTTVELGGILYVSFGGLANSTTVNEHGHLNVYFGGVANSTTVAQWEGYFTINSGGVVNSTTLTVGYMYAYNGGVANGIAIESGFLYVYSGGTATDVDWTPCEGRVSVEPGASVTFAREYTGVYYGSDNHLLASGLVWDPITMPLTGDCRLCIMNGGVAEGVTNGSIEVYSGGVASNISDGSLYVGSGGIADVVTVNTYGGPSVGSGGTINRIVLNSGGSLDLREGGMANSVTVNSSGCVFIYGGTANSVTVNAGGSIYVGSGGTATNIEWTPCEGRVNVGSGGYAAFASEYSGVYYGSGGQLLENAAAVYGMTLPSACEMYVMSEGVVDNTTVNSSGFMQVSGGSADHTTVNSSGQMEIISGNASNTTVNSGGSVHVKFGGTADNITVNTSGGLKIDFGGMANNIAISGGDYKYDSGVVEVLSGGTANGVIVNSKGVLQVESGGTATDIDWTPCEGHAYVYEGANATFVRQYSGVYYGEYDKLLSNTAVMDGKTLYDDYEMYVMDGGTANNTTVRSNGSLYISNGGVANDTTIYSSGCLYAYGGGVANRTTVNHGVWMFVNSGGMANSTTLSGSSGWLNQGKLYVESGGVANDTLVKSYGNLVIYDGGVASNVTVKANGQLMLGGKLTGRMTFEYGAVISGWNYEEGILDFDISDIAPFNTVLVNNLSCIQVMPRFTLTVSGAETTGPYRLAGNAVDFNETITVVNTSGTELGTLTVNGGTQEIDGVKYALTLNKKNVLSVMVGELDPNVFTGELTYATKEIKAGSSAFCVDVNIGGRLKVLKGGTADYTTVNEYGHMHVSKGGTAIETEVNEYGHMHISKGGTARDTTVSSGGSMYVSKGGTARDTTVSSGGRMVVSSGGTASDTTVSSGGSMIISKGGKATKTTVSSGGSMIVSKGTVSSATITSSGCFILSGGTINGLKLENAGGVVSSGGGTINDLTINVGYISFYSGTINRATVDHGDIYVYSGGKLKGATFNGGRLVVSSNCTANKITLENSACMDVYQSKAKASGVTVKTGGSMYISSGAVVSNVTFEGGDVNPGTSQYAGQLAAYGGTIKGLKIGSGTSVYLGSGCTVKKLSWTPGNGVVNIWGASVSFTSKYSGVYVGSNYAFVKNTKELVSETFKKGASAYVAKSGVASGLEITSGGSVFVWKGGKALQTKVGIGEGYSYMDVSSGGTVETVTIFENGLLGISSGGKAGDVTICSGGYMYISKGTASGIKVESGGSLGVYNGTATDVDWTPFNGELSIYGSAKVTFAGGLSGVYIGTNGELTEQTDEVLDRTLGQVEETGIKFTKNDEMYVMSDGKAERTNVGNYGSMYIFDGGSADETAIYNGGSLAVYKGGSASGIEVNGGEIIVYGGTATDVTLNGYMAVAGGSAVNVTISSGYYGYVEEGGLLNSATLCSGNYRNGAIFYISSGGIASNITLEYGAVLFVSKGAKVTNITSSYGSLIVAAKGATVKNIKAKPAVSPDSDHDETNGWENKKKKTVKNDVLKSDALTLSKPIYSSIEFDTNGPMSYDSYHYKNYVGYTDEIDFKKIHLDGTAMLSFQITATDAAKFTIWEWNGSKMVSKQSTALKVQEESWAKGTVSSLKEYYVETKGIILEGGKDYYLSVESTNASKGGNAYYYVYLNTNDSKFFGTPNNDDDKWNNLTDDYSLGTLGESKNDIVRDWVGYKDAVDYRKFTVEGEKTNLRFEIQSSEVTTFTIWKYDSKKKKLVSLQKTSIQDYCWEEYQYGTTTDQIQLDAGEYYFSVESPNAKKGGNADYKISVRVGTAEIKSVLKAALAMPETSEASALAMPETSDELAMSDALSFGGYDTDVLADASASALADLDDKSVWQSLLA